MSSLPPDPYKILGVSKDAQVPEIRSAHRKLVLKCHPDKVQDPDLKAQKQDEFQKVQQAYELLSNEKERSKYDDNVKLAELRKQMQNKANISSPRSSPKYAGEYEIRTAEPRPSTFKTPSHSSPGAKVYTTYSRSWEDDLGHGPRIFEAEIRTSSRREASYTEKPSKRESERERERDREARDQKERDRAERRRRQDEEIRREEKAAKEAKEARRAEKKAREKLRDKEIKRATDEKRRPKQPYIEPFEEDLPMPKSDKKKSSKKHDEKRERSSHREEVPIMAAPPPPMPTDRETFNLANAASYIARSRGSAPTLARSATTYHAHAMRNVAPLAPPAPTPPPAQSSAFPAPADDEEVVRSSARPRRGSSDAMKGARSTYKKSSREFTEEPLVMDASPTTRHTPQFAKSSTTTPLMASSPPHRDMPLPRTNTMPADQSYPRPAANMTRASTFSYGERENPRGRSRSRLQSQVVDEVSESEDEYEQERERRHRERKHRSGKKTRSPEPIRQEMRPENVMRYHVNGNRTKLQSSYSRHLEDDGAYYYATPEVHASSRPAMAARDGSYVSGAAPFPKVKTSKTYSYDDVQYSNHHQGYRNEYPAEYAY